MGFRRRTRRRALVAGAAVGAHYANKNANNQASYDDSQEQPEYAAPPQAPVQYAPPPPSETDEIEHLAQLHASGVLTDEEFSAAKAKALGI